MDIPDIVAVDLAQTAFRAAESDLHAAQERVLDSLRATLKDNGLVGTLAITVDITVKSPANYRPTGRFEKFISAAAYPERVVREPALQAMTSSTIRSK